MKYLKIQNDGLLDIRLVALMGGTTKANDKYKIGQFGTGLKYTLAFLFRNNLDFKIYVGEQEVKIGLDVENIQGERFEIIRINGERTSITTRMGEDWQSWMIVRELWCNALDEGSACRDICYDTKGEKGKTTFFIQVDKQIDDVLNHWDKYFIHNLEPLFENNRLAIYPSSGHMCIYKQGVLIHEEKETKTLFRYDVKDATINELREFRGSVAYAIHDCLTNANQKVAEYLLENISEEYYEGDRMDWHYWNKFSPAWREVIGNNKLITKLVFEKIKARGGEIPENIIIVPQGLYVELTKQFEGISAVRTTSEGAAFYEDYDEKVENRIKQAITILEHAGYNMHPELEFRYGWFENKTVLADVNLKEKIVRISSTLLNTSLFEVTVILVEENEHFNTSFRDCSREFQTHFIKLFTQQLLKTAEIEIQCQTGVITG